MLYNRHDTAKWRKYQTRLQRAERANRIKKKLILLLSILGGTTGLFFLVIGVTSWAPSRIDQPRQTSSPPLKPPESVAEQFQRKDLSSFLNDELNDTSTLADRWSIEKNGSGLTINTTIDTTLQKYIIHLLRRPQTLQSAIVVLNPYDGRVLAMAGHDTNGKPGNICLNANYPAASLFKIVSAAAALETAGYSPDKEISYVGRKHTLYKYQLEQPTKRPSRQTNFRKAFASSNNSVFGKMGIYDLGQEALTDYADRFFFNRSIPFDYPMTSSTIDVPENGFGLAENGEMAAPWLVDSITYKTGEFFYKSRCRMLEPPISSKAAAELKILMQDSVTSGTTRSAFWKLRHKRKFKNLDIGAKTGTINDEKDRFKYDWITAFALSPDGGGAISISVLGVHGKKLGVKSTEFARAIIDYYFSSKRKP
jgi:cell division protein FtsI/penicillin-binding protein 2